jgi:predicted peroxiredoxin
MPVQRSLALIFAEANHARLHAGLSLAASAAALGRPVRLFFHGESVAALQPGRHWAGDETCAAAGVPTVAELLATALGLGLPVMACQSGLHLCGLSAATLADGIEAGGMIAFLADAKADEVAVV